jgi:hypothetical protein
MTMISAAVSNHLTDDQIGAVLIGDASASCAAHLRTCADCSARTAQLSAAIEDFTAASLSWSERRSSTLPVPSTLLAGSRLRHLNWAVAAVVLAVAAVGLPSMSHRAPTLEATTAAPTSVAAPLAPIASSAFAAKNQTLAEVAPAVEASHVGPSQETTSRAAASYVAAADVTSDDPTTAGGERSELARDNRMLAAIDDAWDATTPSPADSFQLRSASGSRNDAHFAPL